MAVIDIKLPQRQQLAMTTGVMTCFTEIEQQGKIGDTFRVLGVEFRITEVRVLPLGRVADELWKQNGAATPDDFVGLWLMLHARTGYRPGHLVRVHWVEPVAAAASAPKGEVWP